VARSSSDRNTPGLDAAALERLALAYVGRYATTRSRLAAYLRRKVGARGWTGDEPAGIDRIVERMAAFGYVDDRGFGEARARALARRGFGTRRVAEALRAAGLGEEDVAPIREESERSAWAAALAFARRRRIGAFATESADEPARRKAFAAMIRAGHAPDMARRFVEAAPGEPPEADER